MHAWTCLCRCICAEIHLQRHLCGPAAVVAAMWTCLCRWSYVDVLVLVHLRCLCRQPSGCVYGGTCLDMSLQMPLLVHLRCLCRGACGNVPLQAHLCGHASLPSHIQVYLASLFTCLEVVSLTEQMAAIGLPHLRIWLVDNILCYPFVFIVSLLTCTSVTLVPSSLKVKSVCTLEL